MSYKSSGVSKFGSSIFVESIQISQKEPFLFPRMILQNVKATKPITQRLPLNMIGLHQMNLDVRRAPAMGVPMRLPIPEKAKHIPILAPISVGPSAKSASIGLMRVINDPDQNP